MTPWITPCSLIVVDDSSRFPLHVWRYANGCLGFGIGEVRPDGCRPRPSGPGEQWIRKGAADPLVSDDGRLRLWWVTPETEWPDRLEDVFRRPETHGGVFALVDLHGTPDFNAEKVCLFLEQRAAGVPVICWPVSAYHSGAGAAGAARVVRPKSRETLRRMVQEIRRMMGEPEDDLPGPCCLDRVPHILVSGAGFEIRDPHGGFGMPTTRELLEGMEEPFWLEMGKGSRPRSGEGMIRLEPASGGYFPVPRSGIWEPNKIPHEQLGKLARERDLDSYWDVLLEGELAALYDPSLRGDQRSRARRKAWAMWHERRLRQAFRHSLLQHDWGFMTQSLDAARLPLHAWLTTNYTHFANRAISLYDDADQGKLGQWRIVATAAEARTLAREDVDLDSDEPDPAAAQQETHGDVGTVDSGSEDQEALPAKSVDAAGRARYLFKLHGDIAHLQTMAIAGHDKDVFSPLSMPIDDLYEVYAAAERFLLNKLRRSDSGLVVWHIVGHGLLDRRLRMLLRRVALQLAVQQVFAVVSPYPEEPTRRLQRVLSGGSHVIYQCKLTAGKYMARLHRLCRDSARAEEVFADPRQFGRWLDAAQSGFEPAKPVGQLY
jgi:hypothetical protein